MELTRIVTSLFQSTTGEQESYYSQRQSQTVTDADPEGLTGSQMLYTESDQVCDSVLMQNALTNEKNRLVQAFGPHQERVNSEMSLNSIVLRNEDSTTGTSHARRSSQLPSNHSSVENILMGPRDLPTFTRSFV